MTQKETIIICSAHSDDFAIGAGGTIAQYVREGKKILVLIFSYGEKSHPWLKENIVQKMRSKESLEAGKILGCEIIFFDLREFDFLEDYQKKSLEKRFLLILNKAKPTKIFTHSSEDPHPDHKAVNAITMELWQKLRQKPELYIYSVWNPVSFKTSYPSFYVNISKTFGAKLSALKTFRSQKFHAIYPLFTLILFRAMRDGLKLRKMFGEHFYRIK
ncbi:PIG-L family deacetylase [Candidatus Woesearchaeota archaeon]|nr:PIG-L family deacetylase [Candidatus Woesearchaeota archaeon]